MTFGPSLSYLQFWGIARPLFLSAPSMQELFLPKSWESGIQRLQVAFMQECAIAIFTGTNGVGKTTLAKWLHRQLPTDNFESILLQLIREQRDSNWLLPKIAQQLGLGPTALE